MFTWVWNMKMKWWSCLTIAIYDLSSKAPSIDTPLHGFLPFKHIDHLHPDAAIAIAAAKDGKKITEELFNGTIGWVEWQRPGFELGLELKRCLDANPGIRGIMLGSHGLLPGVILHMKVI